ncbi:MAG: NBR1-Ig-like domain-containing protein [Anaerolineales bacterium]
MKVWNPWTGVRLLPLSRRRTIRGSLCLAGALLLASCDVLGTLPQATMTMLPSAAPTAGAVIAEPTGTSRPLPAATLDVPPSATTPVEATPTTSGTPSTTATRTPWPTPTTPCFRADYLRDIRIIDGTRFDPGAIMLKIWRIENSGTCSWRGGVTLQFLSGDPLAGPAGLPAMLYQPGAQLEIQLDEINWSDLRLYDVEPGQAADLVAFFRAPDEEGEYRSLWQLTGPGGEPMGQVYLFIRVRSTAERSLRSWSGLWRQVSPEDPTRESTLALEQTDQSLHGYYYDESGVPQWIEATVSLDGERVDGAAGELWTDGSIFSFQKLAGGYQFQGRLEEGPFAMSAWCGARGAARIPLDRCFLSR